MDGGEALEQQLSFAQGIQQTEVLQCERQNPTHVTQQALLFIRVRVVVAPCDQDSRGAVMVVGRNQATPRTGDVDLERPGGGGGHDLVRVGRGVGPSQRAHNLAWAKDGHSLGVERFGDPFGGQCECRLAIGTRRDGRQKVRQLVGRPGARKLLRHQATAKMTNVSLWKPLMPRVRAISPYV